VRTSTARAYLGPDPATVARRALVLTAALVANPLPANRAGEVLTWLADCWEAAYEVAR